MKSTIAKKTEGYGYKYTELADINKYCEDNGIRYWQEIETSEINQKDYIITYIEKDGKVEERRGCQIVEAVLQGIKNPVQEYGSSLTYCRRYSLLMALGLATEDDDGASFTQKKEATKEEALNWSFTYGKYKDKTMLEVIKEDKQYVSWYLNNKANEFDKKCYELLTGEHLPTDDEMDERIKLQSELNHIELEYDIPHEKTLEAYKVNSTNEMTVFQLMDAISRIKKAKENK